MKKTGLFAMLLAALLILTACGGSTGGTTSSSAWAGDTELGNDTYGYVYLKGTWETVISEADDAEMLSYMDDDGNVVDLSLNLVAGDELTLDEMIEFYTEFYELQFAVTDIAIDENGSFQDHSAVIMTGQYDDPYFEELFKLKVWFFEDANGQLRYVAVEARPSDIDALASAVEETFALTKR